MKLFSKKKRTSSKKEAAALVKTMRRIQRRIDGPYRFAGPHWFVAKMIGLAFVFVVAIFAYLFHQRISQEAFESAADVSAVGVEDVDIGILLDVLIHERERATAFGDIAQNPPLSFDPALYGVALQPVSSSDSSTNEGDAAPVED